HQRSRLYLVLQEQSQIGSTTYRHPHQYRLTEHQ
ncbi:hypothetical protein D050_4819B, partial [Vibrio parahaemolyticus VPCR-2009]